MDVLLMAGGLVLLLLGGGWLVSGAVGVARRLRLSPLVIGVTLVGMGTSLPELLTSMRAALAGAPGIALGNVVGSNICNVLLILGAAAMLAPVAFGRDALRRDGLLMLAVTLAGAAWVWLAGGIGRTGGALFLAAFAAWLLWQLRTGTAPEDEADGPPVAMGRAAILCLLGFAGVLAGAEALVRGAIGAARAFGVSEAVIGLSVVAVGTSLPELATSVVAAWRGRADVALGNVLGSNVFNLLGILGATAVVAPLAAEPRILSVDLPAMAVAAAALLLLGLRGRIDRPAGGALLAAYGAYVWTLLP